VPNCQGVQNKWGGGGSIRRNLLAGLRYYCYEALYVCKVGVCSHENASSTKILLADKNISARHLC